LQNSNSNNERLFVEILEKYRSLTFSWDIETLTARDDSKNIEGPGAYQQLYTYEFLSLFEIESHSLSTEQLHPSAQYVSNELLFVLYILVINDIKVRVINMTLRPKIISQILDSMIETIK